MTVKSEIEFKQRPDLTFKFNAKEARHGWLRLTPAYSVKVVDEILNKAKKQLSVIDPFSGTATTTLCAAMKGHDAVSVDINPFLVWFGKAKVANYSGDTLHKTKTASTDISNFIKKNVIETMEPPPIFNIERWWNDASLFYLCRLKCAIEKYSSFSESANNLLKIAFCRTVIDISNVAFNHQSMSFKSFDIDNKQLSFLDEIDLLELVFENNIDFVLKTAASNPSGKARVIFGDSRKINEILDERFDLLITSPPYPNRMSYIRELRPYMYWLDYLKETREAGEMDWETIGGTWGIATSRLANWNINKSDYLPEYLIELMNKIAISDSKSGLILSNYIGKYFQDIWRHIQTVKYILKENANVHYIVGNSKFYDIIIPVERIFCDMLKEAGFQNPGYTTLRKRSSKKELFEFDVHAAV